MAKKASKNAPQPEGGKAFIVIVLAFFMMLTIGLGYTTYEFNSQIEGATASKTEAEKTTADAKKEIEFQKERVSFYKAFVGTATPDDQTTLGSLKNDAAIRQEHADLMQKVQSRVDAVAKAQAANFVNVPGGEFRVVPSDTVTWPWPDGGVLAPAPTPTPLVERLVELMAQKEMANRRATQQLKNVTELEVAMTAAKTAYEDEKKKLAAVAARLPMEAAAEQLKLQQEAAARLAKFDVDMKAYRVNKNELEGYKNEKIALEDKVRDINSTIKELNEKIAAKEAEKDDLFPFDTPKGVVENRRGQVVEINLGSADNVKPGLTFNIMPLEVKERGLQSRTKNIDGVSKIVPKGTVEVVEVLGPNLSTARVTSEIEPVREPIMKTDLLYNAAWRKGQADHVVFVGVFDVDGDGTDDTRQIVREVARMGIIVDGYYDLVERKWIGGAPTNKTNYVIEGEYPKIVGSDALLLLKTDLSNTISAAKKEGTDKGAKAVRHRDFFPRIGYTVNYDVSDERINQAANKFLRPREEKPEGK